MPSHLAGACLRHRPRRLSRGSRGAHAADPPSAEQRAFLEIYRELVEINTTDSVGDTRARGAGHGGAPARRRDSRRGHPGALPGPAQGQPGGALARHRRTRRCCCSRISMSSRPSARTGTRSVQAGRGRRLFPRPRRHRRQGDGRDLRRQPDPLVKEGYQARPRHHPCAHRRRGAVGFAAQRRALAAGAPSRSDRCRIRDQRRRRRRIARRQTVPARGPARREGLPDLPARGHGSRRPQRRRRGATTRSTGSPRPCAGSRSSIFRHGSTR